MNFDDFKNYYALTMITDCLKLFVLLNSLLRFDDWLNCYRQMKEISSYLDKE